MLGYKAAKNGDTRVVITLEIPEDALTNLKRTSIVNSQKAKYRANKVKVLKIEDAEGNAYETAETGFFAEKKLSYKVGEVLEEPTYDSDIEQVCSRGLHFFLDRKVAEQYDLYNLENGLLEKWYDDGRKCFERLYKDGKKEGMWQTWYNNGQKSSEGMIKEGKQEGLWQYWYANGQREYEGLYKDGKRYGLRQQWYENGQREYEGMYKDGKQEGLWQRWYKNGQREYEGMYKDGKQEGVWQSWYENGQKYSEGMYKDGNQEGMWQE